MDLQQFQLFAKGFISAPLSLLCHTWTGEKRGWLTGCDGFSGVGVSVGVSTAGIFAGLIPPLNMKLQIKYS